MGDENKNIPDWKADFPISKTEAGYVARRDFLKVITLFSGIIAVASVFIPVFSSNHSSKAGCTAAPFAIALTETANFTVPVDGTT